MKRYNSLYEKFIKNPKFKQFIKKLPPNLVNIIDHFNEYGYETRIVGGAVRDLFLDIEPRDIDIITKSSPDETMYILGEYQKQNKQIETEIIVDGIRHGTVKIRFLETLEEYEITSLDYVIEKQDNNLSTTYKNTWVNDAERRDFTINAMSLDMVGNLYDYFNGKQHLMEEYVKFIGDYKTKIKNDPALIYRFFKLFAKFKNPKYDRDSLIFMKNNVFLVNELSNNRKLKEVEGIKSQPYGDRVTKYIERNFEELL